MDHTNNVPVVSPTEWVRQQLIGALEVLDFAPHVDTWDRGTFATDIENFFKILEDHHLTRSGLQDWEVRKIMMAAFDAWQQRGERLVAALLDAAMGAHGSAEERARHADGLTPRADADLLIKAYLLSEIVNACPLEAHPMEALPVGIAPHLIEVTDATDGTSLANHALLGALRAAVLTAMTAGGPMQAAISAGARYSVAPVVIARMSDPDIDGEGTVTRSDGVRVTLTVGNRRFRRTYVRA